MRRLLSSIFILLGFCVLAQAMESQNRPEKQFGYVNSQCEHANGELFKQAKPIVIPAVNGENKDGIYATHPGMHKTLLAIEIGSAIKSALKSHESSREIQKSKKLLKILY